MFNGSVSAASAKKYTGQNLKTSGKGQKATKDAYKDVLVNNMVCTILSLNKGLEPWKLLLNS